MAGELFSVYVVVCRFGTLATTKKGDHMRYSQKTMIEGIKASGGILSHAAKMIGCDRSTLYRYCAKYPAVAEALEEAKENTLDIAESELMKLVKEGNITAIIFTLKTLGKSRGYTEKQQIEHSGGIDAGATGVLRIGPALSVEEWTAAAEKYERDRLPSKGMSDDEDEQS